MIGKIAVSAAVFAIDKPYSYRFGDDMPLQVGMRVQVPFGAGNRRCEGIVLEIQSGDEQGLKPVDQMLDDEPLLSPVMLRLAAFMTQRYYCTFYEAARVMLPGGLWFRTVERFTLAPEELRQGEITRQPDARKIADCLKALGGAGTMEDLKTAVPEEEARTAAIKYLLRKKWITRNRTSCAEPATGRNKSRPLPRLRRKPWSMPPTAPDPLPCSGRCWSCCAAWGRHRSRISATIPAHLPPR